MKTKESRVGGEKRRMEYLANGVTCRHTNMVNIFFPYLGQYALPDAVICHEIYI